MSEQNIINPTQAGMLNPDYGYTEGLPELRTVMQSMSGKMFTRRQRAAGRIFQLIWSCDLATMHTLKQWEEQYLNDFFSYSDYERARYFSGRFDGPLSYSIQSNNNWNVRGNFVELPGLNLYQYPSNWPRDAIFLEERDGFGADLVKLTGTWTYFLFSLAHGGAHYTNGNTNTTDKAEWVYFGYGCRLWAAVDTSLGIQQVTVTRVRDGAVMASALVDLYRVAAAASAPVFGENLLQYSQDFENAAWLKDGAPSGPTVTADTTVAPDGSTTADTVAFPATGAAQFSNLHQQIAGLVTVGVPYTFSVWLKASSAVQVNLSVRDTNLLPNQNQLVNVTTAWQRFSLTVTPQAGASTTVDALIYSGPSAGAVTVFAWGAQLERDVTAPLDYIPTQANSINLSLPLDTYRVAVTATNTKNAASSGTQIRADALQVMR